MPTARSRRPSRRLWAAAAGAALVVQLLVLYAPHAPSAAAVPGADKLVHLALFAAVTVAALRAGLSPALVTGFGVVHAVVSEVVQHTLLPGRSGDPLDAVADVLGVLGGVVLARALGRQRRATT